jgi:hypothetical protein
MQVHAKLNALVVDVLRIVRCVDIAGLLGLHPLVVMIENCLDHTVSYGLSNHLLCLFNAFKRQLLCDVTDRDLRVTNVDLLETKLDNSVAQALNERKVLIC